ncbi:MAG: sodium:proton antiporter, partial [Mycobacterium sp.]
VPLLGQVPIDTEMVTGGDSGSPVVLSPDSIAGKELRRIADQLATRGRGLVGMSLGLETGNTQR